MALGTLAGIGIKGLKALLDVDEKTMVKLMSDTPMDDAAHLLPPETIYRINNALSMSRADQLPTDLEKAPTNAQVRKLLMRLWILMSLLISGMKVCTQRLLLVLNLIFGGA